MARDRRGHAGGVRQGVRRLAVRTRRRRRSREPPGRRPAGPRPLSEADARGPPHLPGAGDAHPSSASRSRRASPGSSGRWWRSAAEAGLALTLHDGVFESQLPGRINGAETRWLAERITSWNMFEASLALGAVNAWFNRRDRVERLLGRPLVERARHAAVRAPQPQVRGRLRRRRRALPAPRAAARALHAHHPRAATPWAATCPTRPASTCSGSRTASASPGAPSANKTLPRLLELSRDAYVVLVGPSVPLAPVWFDYGVDLLAGTVVLDTDGALAAVQQGGRRSLFGDSLAMVELEAADVATRDADADRRGRRVASLRAATPSTPLERRHARLRPHRPHRVPHRRARRGQDARVPARVAELARHKGLRVVGPHHGGAPALRRGASCRRS